MAKIKTQPTEENAQTFMDRVEPPQRREDAIALAALMARVSGLSAVMWGGSIVGFGTSRYPLAGGREGEICAIGFAPRKPHLVLYLPGAVERDGALLDRLGKHATGKGCLYIKRLADIDPAILGTLVGAAWDRRAPS